MLQFLSFTHLIDFVRRAFALRSLPRRAASTENLPRRPRAIL